jgi:pyruvate,water dikinase
MTDVPDYDESRLRALQERAKELDCLYNVDDLLKQADQSLAEACRGIVDVLPQGWQHPHLCEARITIGDLTIQKAGFQGGRWIQSADIRVDGRIHGKVEVFYREWGAADAGDPFLPEERKLIETVAERIAAAIAQRKIKGAFSEPAGAANGAERGECRIILDFLRGTDPILLRRISRKLINHLSWSGILEAKALLRRRDGWMGADGESGGENRPQLRELNDDNADFTAEAFRIAGQHLSEAEIVGWITTWMKEDKSSLLVRALENQGTPLGEIIDALERYRHDKVEESELSVSTQKGLRVSLIRRLFSENLDFINVAKHFIEVHDFYDLLGKIIFPTRCHGKLGGKSAGLFLAQKIIAKERKGARILSCIKVPKTWFITSDWILNFVHYNDLEDVLNSKYMDVRQVRDIYPHLVQLFKRSSFPSELEKGLSLALDDLGDGPLIVRSSSLLEDRSGSAFSGKYKSLFLGNRGTKQERLAALLDAIAEVYASVFGPDPTEYRAERGLLDVHEEMGIMIQQVVGKTAGKYFFPACSGVALSHNEFRWSARIRREDGLIRLVPGLGTRAVDRVADDYPVLIAPGQPKLRVNVTVDEVVRYSPNRVDVINLETNTFDTLPAAELLRSCGADYPRLHQLVSYVDRDRITQPVTRTLDLNSREVAFTFEGLIQNTPFISWIRELLKLLHSKLGTPVEIEFAYDGEDFYLLQCRPQSYGAEAAPAAIPQDLPADKVIFSANRFVSNGRVSDITHIVYVDPDGYAQLSEESEMIEVGRAVGRLNKLLPKRQFILIGPGRWGSRGDIRLGVPVTYADISNTAMLIEVARQRDNYLPDLSFGTHFFQDLVEASIRYLPLYPDDRNVSFNWPFFRSARNILEEILPDFHHLANTLRVIDVEREAGGLALRVLMNADLDQAVAFLAARQQKTGPAKADLEAMGRPSDEHWRWRFGMAQRIAAQLDPQKFGVAAVYLIGSTKNATAGPASDIDLLLHFQGDKDQQQRLMLYLDGWSRCLDEINFLRTGYHSDGLLDVHLVTDQDIAARSSFAAKIDAVTDPARKLPMTPAAACLEKLV